MNTTTYTRRAIRRTAIAAACIAACFAAATACGTETGTTAAPTAAAPGPTPISQSPHATPAPASTIDISEAEKAQEAAYIREITARHDAARTEPQHPARQHPAGFDKAICGER